MPTLCKTCGAVLSPKGTINYARMFRDFRMRHHLTQEAMARILPMSRKGYQNVEYGVYKPTFATIRRFEALIERYERNQNAFSE